MNVLVLSKTIWPEGSGGELATYLYAKLLTQEGLDVKIVARSISYFKAWNGLSIHSIPALGSGKYTIVPMPKRLKELLQWSEVVYFTDLFHLIPLVKHAFKKPIVVHLHSYFPACPIGSLYNLKENSVCEPDKRDCARCIWCYERGYLRPSKQALASILLNSTVGKYFHSFLKLADALIFVSKAQKDLFLKHVSNFSISSYVICNPLPELSYMPPQGDNLGYFGGLSPLKGFHILLKAWSKVHYKRRARIYATKMGELASLESLRKVGIIPYGRLDEKSYEDVYRKIKAVIFPSIWQEPLPYVVIEALLRGRLLVASRVGGVPEIAEGLKSIFMVEPNDIDSLADALDQVLLMDRDEAIELGLKNREGILRRFDNRRSVNELIRIFEKVVG